MAGFIFILLVPIILVGPGASASVLDDAGAAEFLNGMMLHPDSMHSFLDEEDRIISQRLGITYPEAPQKQLISHELSPYSVDRLAREGLNNQYRVEKIDQEHSRLVLFPDDSAHSQSWIFREGKVVSPVLFKTRNWTRIDSDHFRFIVSDPTLFHPANIDALETFLAETADLLGLSDDDLERLTREKIYYAFCSEEQEIRDLTGFPARGMYMVSHDVIVSTYSSHFHELAHLLMNFRLKQPHLYTHPFFLEGFAVAVGGRGGKTAAIQHQLGLSILRSGWVTRDELLDAGSFRRNSASMSYPGSAVYNRFLLENLETAEYLGLYSRYGGDAGLLNTMRIDPAALPEDSQWKEYLAHQPKTGAIEPGARETEAANEMVVFFPSPDGDNYAFAVPETTLVFSGTPAEDYRSFLMEELLPGHTYEGQRFYVRASSDETAVYDLFTNNMIALHALGFSDQLEEIPLSEGLFRFRVDRSVFTPGLEVQSD